MFAAGGSDPSPGPDKEEPRGGRVPGFREKRVGCGEGIRTPDLRVMSPTSCRCSTPRLPRLPAIGRSVKGASQAAAPAAGVRPGSRRQGDREPGLAAPPARSRAPPATSGPSEPLGAVPVASRTPGRGAASSRTMRRRARAAARTRAGSGRRPRSPATRRRVRGPGPGRSPRRAARPVSPSRRPVIRRDATARYPIRGAKHGPGTTRLAKSAASAPTRLRIPPSADDHVGRPERDDRPHPPRRVEPSAGERRTGDVSSARRHPARGVPDDQDRRPQARSPSDRADAASSARPDRVRIGPEAAAAPRGASPASRRCPPRHRPRRAPAAARRNAGTAGGEVRKPPSTRTWGPAGDRPDRLDPSHAGRRGLDGHAGCLLESTGAAAGDGTQVAGLHRRPEAPAADGEAEQERGAGADARRDRTGTAGPAAPACPPPARRRSSRSCPPRRTGPGPWSCGRRATHGRRACTAPARRTRTRSPSTRPSTTTNQTSGISGYSAPQIAIPAIPTTSARTRPAGR